MKALMFVVWLAGGTVDTIGTHRAIDRGAHERILSQNPWIDDGITAGEMTAGAVALEKLYKTKPKTAVVIGIAGGAARLYLSRHNWQVGTESHR